MNSRLCEISGALSPILAFTFIAMAILTHPWFSFNHNALSDLGALHTEDNWIFNTGLILGGITAVIFSISIQGKGENRVENAAYVIFLSASIFMLLIGLFPEDTAPHRMVSVLFYLSAAIGIFTSGIGYILSRKKMEGWISIILVLLAIFLSAGIRWGGIAMPETIGAIAITIWLYMLIFRMRICER